MPGKSDYKLSFSTGGLFLRESVELAAQFHRLADWALVKKHSESNNVLQTRTTASSKRAIREIVVRLQKLNSEELELLIEGSNQEQRYLLWIAICRSYPFIGEFAKQILREHFVTMKGVVQYEDFDYFYNKKADFDHRLDEISETTRNKLRQVLFRIMRECGLLAADNSILPAILTPRLIEVVSNDSRKDLMLFPLYEEQVRSMEG